MYNKTLLTSNNAKTIKGEKKQFKTFILYMSPFTLNSKGVNLCPMASEGCSNSCLFESGFGGIYTSVKNGRTEKTEFYLSDRIGFLDKLVNEITKLEKKFKDSEYTLAIRLNGTTDISYEKQITSNGKTIFDTFPNVQFYDYTKVLGRKVKQIANYHLTFSAADGNDSDVAKAIAQGYNIAAVFDRLPAEYMGLPVINADEDDLRFLDGQGVVAGLKAKGRAKKDTSGFVRRTIKIVSV